MQRLKAAKSEAKEETAQFQKEQESKFDEISKVYKDGKSEAQIEKQVEETIAEMDKRVKGIRVHRTQRRQYIAVCFILRNWAGRFLRKLHIN